MKKKGGKAGKGGRTDKKKKKTWGPIRGPVSATVLAALDNVPPPPELASAALDDESYWGKFDPELCVPDVYRQDVDCSPVAESPPATSPSPAANEPVSMQDRLDAALLTSDIKGVVPGLCRLFRDDPESLLTWVQDGELTATAKKTRRALKNKISAAASARKRKQARVDEIEGARRRAAEAEARAAVAEDAMRRIEEALRCAEEGREMAERLLAMANARAESAEVALAVNRPRTS